MLSILMNPKGGGAPEALDNKAFFAALSTQLVNNPDKVFIVNDKQYDYSTLNISGIVAPKLFNVLWVDPVYGDDTTAVKNSFDNKYKTIIFSLYYNITIFTN